MKLDLDDPKTEDGIMDYVLNKVSYKVDEILWENHVSGNYLLSEWQGVADMSLKDSYEKFLALRR
eukprot:CAMPEP_0202470088 /NCGR_PEP_ID=MMETSP1360-20130828/80462_1 /ASSEMBLY_ACC=CAM_ASM_000848 /TAXON_ID=515479 /ORGANISM="Licmophora paradoxa, Strain CCMP2313" /LENGTH=64 /DNA_ID=CAMNT_0049095653 /DNA_START=1 /DNA_END=191 /DNA_ORIENTATION=+